MNNATYVHLYGFREKLKISVINENEFFTVKVGDITMYLNADQVKDLKDCLSDAIVSIMRNGDWPKSNEVTK